MTPQITEFELQTNRTGQTIQVLIKGFEVNAHAFRHYAAREGAGHCPEAT